MTLRLAGPAACRGQSGCWPGPAGHTGRACPGSPAAPGLDVTRAPGPAAVVSVITAGAGILAYLAAWALLPEEGEKTSIAQNIIGTSHNARSG